MLRQARDHRRFRRNRKDRRQPTQKKGEIALSNKSKSTMRQ